MFGVSKIIIYFTVLYLILFLMFLPGPSVSHVFCCESTEESFGVEHPLCPVWSSVIKKEQQQQEASWTGGRWGRTKAPPLSWDTESVQAAILLTPPTHPPQTAKTQWVPEQITDRTVPHITGWVQNHRGHYYVLMRNWLDLSDLINHPAPQILI